MRQRSANCRNSRASNLAIRTATPPTAIGLAQAKVVAEEESGVDTR